MKRIVLTAMALAIASPALAEDSRRSGIRRTLRCQVIRMPQSSRTSKRRMSDGSDYLGYTVPGVFIDQSLPPGPHKPRTAVFETSVHPLSGMDGQYIGVINGSDYIISC